MTHDDAAYRTAILRLREDTAGEPAAVAKQRVLSRLVLGAGVTGVGASVANAAAASTAAVSVATPATLSLLGLAKVFGIGIVLGTSAGVGLHVAFDADRSEPATLPVPVLAVASAATPAGSASSVTWSSSPVPAVPPFEAAGSHPIARSPRRAPETGVNPTPELPRARADTEVGAEGLAQQQTLLDNGRLALRNGDANAALHAMELHRRRFVRTAFEEERQAVAIKALVMLGEFDAAREKLRQFERAFPKSLLIASLRASARSREPGEQGEVR